jgi:threonine dehydrogenase-like Zn-dependent dehydrogenase
MCFKQLSQCPVSLYGRHAGGRDIDNGAALTATQPAIAEAIITHRFPLDAAVEAFAAATDRSSGAINVVIEP